MYKTTILLIFMMLVTLAITGCENSKEAEYQENKRIVEEALAEKEIEEKNAVQGKLEVVKNFTFKADGNYTYLEGSVINKSNKDVTYFKVTAEYKDKNGKVVDTAYTNSGQTLRPGNEKRIEIMNKYGGNEEEVNIIVEEVKYGN